MAAEPPPHLPIRDAASDQVAAYLRAHPEFLAARPELYASLHPPSRLHGAGVADHMAAMIGAARAHATEMEGRAASVLAASRAAAGIAERVQEAVLAAIGATDLVDCVTETWPGLLGVDACTLCCEGSRPRWRSLPPGTVAALLQTLPMTLRDHPVDAALLYAEAALLAERDLLVRLPGGRPALLALASREAACLPRTQAWVFLGRVISVLTEGPTASVLPFPAAGSWS